MLSLVLALATISCFIIHKVLNKKRENYQLTETWFVVGIVGIILTLLVGLVNFAMLTDSISGVQKFQSAKETITRMREDSNLDDERTMLAGKVVDWNAWLANAKYWNEFWLFDWFTTDRIEELSPIR